MIDTLTPILPPYVDSTMMSAFKSCPRKFYHEFILGLRPPGISIDLHAGGVFAHCLEVVRHEIFLNGRSLPDAIIRANAAFEIAWGDFVIPEHKKTNKRPDRVWAAVESYFDQYPPHLDHIQPYFVNGKPTFEFTFAIPLDLPGFPSHPITGEPFFYSGRFDMLGEYMGVPIVEDDKTSGSGHYAHWSESWDLRSQFIGYTWACQQLGLNVNDVAVRGVGIQMTQIAHAEAIKPYSNHLRERWLTQLGRDLTRLVNCWNEGYFDYNFGEACTSFGNCMFMQPCQSNEPEPWLKTFEVKRWNPTQKDPTKEAPATASSPLSSGSPSPSSSSPADSGSPADPQQPDSSSPSSP